MSRESKLVCELTDNYQNCGECVRRSTATESSIHSPLLFARKDAVILAPMVRICSLAFRTLCSLNGADVVFTEEVVAAKLARSRREVVCYPSITSPIAEYVVYEKYKHTEKRSVVFATFARAESVCNSKQPITNSADCDLLSHFVTENESRPNSFAMDQCTLPHYIEFEKTKRVPVILQLGVADPCLASVAVERCGTDIDGVDLNMGCPKKFSVGNGFGAVLMDQPEKAGSILYAIRDALLKLEKNKDRALHFGDSTAFSISSIETDAMNAAESLTSTEIIHCANTPVEHHSTCQFVSFKTRLKSTALATAEMLRSVLIHAHHSQESKCVDAITIHAREREQHSSETPQYVKAAETVRLCRADHLFDNIVFILNGSITSREDGVYKCHRWGFDASMMARSAMWDATRFLLDREQPLNLTSERTLEHVDIVDNTGSNEHTNYDRAHYMSFLKQLFIFSIRFRTSFANFKYHLTRTFPEVAVLKPLMKVVQQQLQSYSDCFALFDCSTAEISRLQYCLNNEQTNWNDQRSRTVLECLSEKNVQDNMPSKRMKTEKEAKKKKVKPS